MQIQRTTLNLDRELLEEALALKPGLTRTAVVEAGLRSLIAREAALRLAALARVILVDTCAWIRHLRAPDPRLIGLLSAQRVVACDVVIGELRLGSGVPALVEELLGRLPSVPCASARETRAFIDRHRSAFRGAGVGWADAMLMASAAHAGAMVYTAEEAVRRTWRALGFREAG